MVLDRSARLCHFCAAKFGRVLFDGQLTLLGKPLPVLKQGANCSKCWYPKPRASSHLSQDKLMCLRSTGTVTIGDPDYFAPPRTTCKAYGRSLGNFQGALDG